MREIMHSEIARTDCTLVRRAILPKFMEANIQLGRGFVAFPEPAGCPHCGSPLSKSLFFTKLPLVHLEARCCGGMYRLHGGRELLTGAFFGLAWSICLLSGWLGFISWTAAACAIAGVFSFAYVLSPYLIRVEKAGAAAGAGRSAKTSRTASMPGRRRIRLGQVETAKAAAEGWEQHGKELLRAPAQP